MSKYPIKVYKERSHNYYMTTLEYFTDARIVGKSLEFDKTKISNDVKSYYEFPFVFNFRFVDSKKEIFNEKINIEFKSRRNFYSKISYFQKLKLLREYKKLWIQQPENIKWIVMAIFAGIGSFVALTKFFFECK